MTELRNVQHKIDMLLDQRNQDAQRSREEGEAAEVDHGNQLRGMDMKSSAMETMSSMLNDPASMMQIAGIAGGIMTGGALPAALTILGGLGGGGGLGGMLKGGK